MDIRAISELRHERTFFVDRQNESPVDFQVSEPLADGVEAALIVRGKAISFLAKIHQSDSYRIDFLLLLYQDKSKFKD